LDQQIALDAGAWRIIQPLRDTGRALCKRTHRGKGRRTRQ
jgi:hypothetical protein